MGRMKSYQKKDKEYIWHPFTQMSEWLKNDQIVISHGKGNYLYDVDGNKYLDGVSSLWVNIHGHNHKELNKEIIRQIEKVSHSTLLGLGNIPSIELAEKLVGIAPKSLKKVFYSDNGSTAVEIALKIAYQYWQQVGKSKKKKFIKIINAYHGDTIGSVSVGGIDLFHKVYKPLLFGSFKAPSPYCYRCSETKKCDPSDNAKCILELKKIIQNNHKKIAGLIIEPMIQAAAGMLTMPKGYMKAVRSLCTKYNILLICDEVATGFGRTGKMFACEHEKISPDIMCLAKGITGGYLPLAATLVTQKIYKGFLGEYEDKKTFYHGHTYTGNPVACAASIASLKIFKKEKVLQKLAKKIKILKLGLRKFNELENVGDIRQCGFMVGIELVKEKRKKTPFPMKEKIGHKVILDLRKKGIISRPLGDVIVLMPPLSITTNELEYLLSSTFDSIRALKM
jgi:adenosylmethionine-8-amino-7-oxononanoate transaminase